MEDPSSMEEDDSFFNALEDFPYYDCTDESEPRSNYSTTHSPPAVPSSSDSKFTGFGPNKPSLPGLRRRRSFAKHRYRELPSEISDSSIVSELTGEGDSGMSGVVDSLGEDNGEVVGEDQPGFLFILVELLIKAIGFQLSLFIGFFTFPFRFLYTSYMFLLDPFLAIQRARDNLRGKVIKTSSFVSEAVPTSISEWFKENHSCFKVAVKCAWGFLWAAYVGSILVGLLVSAFVASGLIMRRLVEEPFHQKHWLNFDFTENKPVATVAITASSPRVEFGESLIMENHLVAARVLPPNRKLQATVSLTLPESEYNRRLGMFQVRIEFLCAKGKTLASLRQPCILHFISDPIRMLQRFIKVVPLVTGYSSESQKVSLRFQGFTEGDVPCSYVNVIIEQRAEFRPASGIPEIYDAALLLESELPLLKSIVWSWRKTLFVWLSMVLFMIELLFALVCCRMVVMPSLRLQNNAAAGNTATPTHEQNAG